MLPKRIIFIGILLLCFFAPHAQVNLQTGSATFSIPMFNWQDDKSRLNASVSLNYSSGNGLRVNDIASNIGQGWSLAAGGVISRMQVGDADDQKPYLGNMSVSGSEVDMDLSKYPAGYLYAPVPAYNGCPNALDKYPIYKSRNQVYTPHNKTAADKQMDYFVFQFNGKTGMFVLDTRSGNWVGVPLDGSMLKISVVKNEAMPGIRTTIESFTIQDVNGLIYKFTQPGKTQVLHQDYTDAKITVPRVQPKFTGGNVYFQAGFPEPKFANATVIGSWYLSEIDDPFTARKISYNYVMQYPDNIGGVDLSYNLKNDYSTISFKRSISATPEISSITFQDGHLVTFNYGAAARADLNGELPLASVDISYQGRILSRYQLNTSYFILNRYGTPVSAYQKSVSRLCLRSVKKIGVDLKDDSPPYIFDYNLGSDVSDDFVPPPFFYEKDNWGFYNGSNSKDYNGNAITPGKTFAQLNNADVKGLCFLRSSVTGMQLTAKQGYAKNGLLRQVIYPTGGTLSYQYDQNTGLLNGTNTMVGGVHVIQTSSTDGGFSNSCSNPVITHYNYVMGGPGSASSLWGLEMPVNSITTGNHYASEQRHYHWTLRTAPLGECYWQFLYPGILSQLQAVDLVGLQKVMEAIAPVLGVVTIITDIMDIATVVGGSTGFFAIAALVVDIVGALLSIGFTCLSGDNHKDDSYTVYYNMDLNGASPLPTQFKRVEIVEGSGTMGRTVQEFTCDDDYAVWVAAGANTDFSAKQRFAPWAYGLPKLTTLYDKLGNMVKQVKNVYDFGYARQIVDYCSGKCAGIPGIVNPSGLNTPLVSCKCEVKYNYSQPNTTWSNVSLYDDPNSYLTASLANGDITVDYYAIAAGRVELDSTYERAYKSLDPTQYVETVTGYLYDPANNHETRSIIVRKSEGGQTSKNFTYATDYRYAQDAMMNLLLQNNLVSFPISTYTDVSGGTNAGTLNEKVTEFGQLSNGDVKPVRTLEQRFAKPTYTSYYIPGGSNNSSLYKVTETLMYDGFGNLIGAKDEGGRVVSNIYDYNDKYIVASVANADPVLDMPAYTSFETAVFGGWSLNGSGSAFAGTAITGLKYFSLSSSATLSAHLNTSKAYTLSFWSTGGMTVNGGTLVKSAPVISGFTYYEYSIAQGNSVVVLSGSANIDELRLYPQTARMRTTTYDPAIGKTSDCDENNRATYYEYDNLGRLRIVKDENHYVVKMYEYNTISPAKQNGCPGIYYNHLATEFFTKSDCAAGYLGDDVPFTVPAAKYSSTLSQEDADNKAEVDLLTNGPSHANSIGQCHQIFYNIAWSETDSTESCDEGMKGGLVTYTVPPGRYSSIISQQIADQEAKDELAANAAAYANSPYNRNCVIDTYPDYVHADGDPISCQNIHGSPHTVYWAIDMNPNSPTYNNGAWKDMGVQSTPCASTGCTIDNCSGEGKKCLFGSCATGSIVYTSSVQGGTLGWICTYHYVWSDGSISGNYTKNSAVSCPVQ